MSVLGIDTASYYPSAAIVEDGRVLVDQSHRGNASVGPCVVGSRSEHSEILLPLIDAALRSAGFTLSDLSGYAVSVGPGSFTGLRVGLSTVQGLAYGHRTPVTGVSTLHAIARTITAFNGLICSVLDARREEAYAALFRAGARPLQRVSEDLALSCDELVELLRERGCSEPILLAGYGAAVHGPRLIAELGPHVRISPDESRPTVAAAVALLGEAALKPDTARSLASLAPQYLHRAGQPNQLKMLG